MNNTTPQHTTEQPNNNLPVDKSNCRPKYIPTEKIRELIEIKELNTVQAAAILGCTKQSIRDRCIRHGIKYGLKRFKEQKADILASKQRQLLDTLSSDEIKKMSPGSRVTAFAILYDKERLERGQSTENIAYCDMSKTLSDMDKEIERLAGELEGQMDDTRLDVSHNNLDDDFMFDDEGSQDTQAIDIIEDTDDCV